MKLEISENLSQSKDFILQKGHPVSARSEIDSEEGSRKGLVPGAKFVRTQKFTEDTSLRYRFGEVPGRAWSGVGGNQ